MRVPAFRSDLLTCRGVEHRNVIERVPSGFLMGLLGSASNALLRKRREKGFCYRVAVADAAPAHRMLKERPVSQASHSKGPIWAADFIEAQRFRDGTDPANRLARPSPRVVKFSGQPDQRFEQRTHVSAKAHHRPS